MSGTQSDYWIEVVSSTAVAVFWHRQPVPFYCCAFAKSTVSAFGFGLVDIGVRFIV